MPVTVLETYLQFLDGMIIDKRLDIYFPTRYSKFMYKRTYKEHKIKTICIITGCHNVLGKYEYRICQMHKSRFYRHGDYNISPKWNNLKKGTPLLTTLGYLRINVNGKRVLHHRHIMEQFLGRKLKRREHIHHKNGIKTDNRTENLELCKNHSIHMKNNHPNVIENNRNHPRYVPELISKIMERINSPKLYFDSCFCGTTIKRKVLGKGYGRYRNLCVKHLAWASRHKQ